MSVQKLALGLVACAALVSAFPAPRDDPPPDPAFVPMVHVTAAADECPGYAASNVVKTGSSLTADLTLAGPACNVFSTDIKDLKLLVEYQTGKSRLSTSKHLNSFILRDLFYPTSRLKHA